MRFIVCCLEENQVPHIIQTGEEECESEVEGGVARGRWAGGRV